MSNIYIVHDTGALDFSSATKWGTLTRVCSGPVNPFKPEDLYPAIWPYADKFDLEKDFLVLCGNMVPMMVFVARLARRVSGGAPVNVLVWDAATRKYTIRSFRF